MLKKEAEQLMKIKGEARGIVFKTDAGFILKKKGREGLKKIEKELRRIGQPINYEKIEVMNFYPIGLRALSLLVIQKVFGFSDKDIEQMGAQAPKASLITKLFMRYFFSIKKTAEQVPKMWEKHYTVGKLSVETDEEKRYIVLQLKDFVVHPILCCYLAGYFSTVAQMVVNAPVTCQETKCLFKGNKYHEFVLKW